MKWLVVLIGILCLVASVGALQLDFQQSSELAQVEATPYAGGVTLSYIDDTSGGNSYIRFATVSYTGAAPICVRNSVPLITTYAAATVDINYGGNFIFPEIFLYDASKNLIYQYETPDDATSRISSRIEMKMSGGQAYIYRNGILLATSSALAQNPSYVGFGFTPNGGSSIDIDNYIIGTTENKDIFGMPDNNQYQIIKDIINPAANGLRRTSDGVVVQSTNLPSTWGRGNAAIPPDAMPNEAINLVQWGGMIPYDTQSTGTEYSGTTNFNLTHFFEQNPPYGVYAITIPGSGEYSRMIVYTGSGATVAWNSDTYSVGDTGVVVTYITSGGYWDPALYDYRVDVQDVFGNVIKTQVINTQSGSVSVTFTDSDSLGVYYAIMKATPKAGGDSIWMNYDTAELQAYIVFSSGYVMNAETGALLSGATVNVTQGTATKSSLSGSYGWNSTNNWLSGSQFNITTNLTGYTSDVRLFTPLTSKSIALNISLVPSPATKVGLSVGGVVRDNVYGNPVTSATYWVQNGTAYSSTTNIAGFARVDNLPEATWYNVWSSKTGFGNSSVVPVLAVSS